MPVIRRDFGHLCLSCYLGATTSGLSTCTEISSVLHREFWSDLTASSAVNLPISSASLRLGVIWMGVRSIRCTYSVARVIPRFTFTTNFVFFNGFSLLSLYADGRHHRSTTQALKYWKELKEVLTTHGHRNSPVIDPEFPSSHEADTQSLL
jgi:hypothetical protein